MIYFTGLHGQLGFELNRLFQSKNIAAKGFDVDTWDITNENISRDILKSKPKYLIHCAAYTAVDKAETESELAFAVNTNSTKNLASICKEMGIYIIYISTDFVFADISYQHSKELKFWKPQDEISPSGVYAISKAEGEKAISDLASDYSIIRTSWVYSSHGSNFVKTILKLLADPNRKELKIIEDQVGRPTYAKSLAEFIIQLIIKHEKKEEIDRLHHFSNDGVASWFDFAMAIRDLGLKHGLISESKPIFPIATEEYPTPAKRPRFTVMDISISRKIIQIPYWREDLDSCLKEIKDKGSI